MSQTSHGTAQTQQNVRRRVLAPAIERANEEFDKLETLPIGRVSSYGHH